MATDLGEVASEAAGPAHAPGAGLRRQPRAPDRSAGRRDRRRRPLPAGPLEPRRERHPLDPGGRHGRDRGVGPGRLAVVDDGPGLAPDDHERAFERFYLWDRYGADRPVGTGLGLAIVAELAAAMGGRTTIESAPGEGSVVRARARACAGSGPPGLRTAYAALKDGEHHRHSVRVTSPPILEERDMKRSTLVVAFAAVLATLVAATAAFAAGPNGKVLFRYTGELTAKSSSSVTVSVENGNRPALRSLLGKSQERDLRDRRQDRLPALVGRNPDEGRHRRTSNVGDYGDRERPRRSRFVVRRDRGDGRRHRRRPRRRPDEADASRCTSSAARSSRARPAR